MPIIIDHLVYLNTSELIHSGVTKTPLYEYIKNGSILVHKSEEHGKLIEFSSLKYDWKTKINAFYGGCVKKFVQIQRIDESLRRKTDDRAVLQSYRLPNGSLLEKAKRVMYEKCCAVLALLERLLPVTDGKIRSFGASCVKEFWAIMYDYIKEKDLKLPRSRRLKSVLKKYRKEGATAVISKKFCNKNSSKIGELELKVIIELYADRDGRKFTKKQVHEQFLFIAKENGWNHCENVTYQAIAGLLSKTRGDWHAERHGDKDFKLHQTLVINRQRATEPNLVWQLDGTPECLWYYDPKRKTIDKLYVMKVMDSHSWKIVGYSVGYTETSHLVFEAMKMACTTYQVKPKEVRSDKGSAMQAGETKDLMSNLGATFYPTATGNARAKTIEAWQGLFNQQVLMFFKNKSGANITAKSLESRQNPDKLKKYYKSYPTKAELVKQISLCMSLWNETPDSKGITPNEKYKAPAPRRQDLSIFEQLDLFFIWRKKGKKLVKYRFKIQGLEVEIQGDKYRYLPELNANELADFMNAHIDVTDFYIKYDPSDLTQIGMYQLPKGKEVLPENMRLICDARIKGKTAETFHDATDEQKALLSKLRETQKLQLAKTKEGTEQRRELLEAKNILNGAIELEKVHKDRMNDAKIAVQREQVLGFGSTIMSDTNKELSAISMQEDELFDLPSYDSEDSEPLDVYG